MNRSVVFARFGLGAVSGLALAAGLAVPAGQALAADAIAQQLQAQQQACQQITNESSRQACLREAAAAAAELRQGNGLSQPTEAQQRANSLRRCDRLPEPQRADCLRLRQSPDVRVRGSVEGGGVLRELTIIEYGAPVPADSLPAAPQPGVAAPPPGLPAGVTTQSQPLPR